MRPKRAAIYARVSLKEQNTDLQMDSCERFCEARGWQNVAVVQDHVTGTRERRPGLDQVLAMARGRKIDVLVVWKRDRFFRSTKHLIDTSLELDALGVDFVSVTEQIDTTTPAGKLLVGMLQLLSQFERDVLIERTKAGMAAAKRRGERIGRPRRQVDLEQAKLLLLNHSMRLTARKLNVPLTTLKRRLSAAGLLPPQAREAAA